MVEHQSLEKKTNKIPNIIKKNIIGYNQYFFCSFKNFNSLTNKNIINNIY